MLRLNVKLSEGLLLRLCATFHTLPLFYLRTSILHTYARKNYATVEINPHAINAYFQSNLTTYWKINILLDSERIRNCDV